MDIWTIENTKGINKTCILITWKLELSVKEGGAHG